MPIVGRFKLSEIANMDQTPLAFDFMSARTYDKKRSKTVWQKIVRSGWDRRQATLQVCVYADGIQRCRPLIIFHGAEKGDSRRDQEKRKYHPEVEVLFNPTAWANEKTMLYWIKHMWKLSSAYPTVGTTAEPRLLALDAFEANLTTPIRKLFKQQKTTISVIPGGCTGFVQVLDVSVNKPLKDLIKEEQDDHYDQHIDEWRAEKFNIGQRRILLTHWVAKAWKRLHLEYKDTIINTFQSVGMSLNPDGSEDAKLKIKGLEGIKVGDYRRLDGVPQEEDCEEAALDAEIQISIAENRQQEGNIDSRDNEINITKSSLRSSWPHLSAHDSYYTSKEAEAGDPLLTDNQDDTTTDSDIEMSEDWDSDLDFEIDEDSEDFEMVQDHMM